MEDNDLIMASRTVFRVFPVIRGRPLWPERDEHDHIDLKNLMHPGSILDEERFHEKPGFRNFKKVIAFGQRLD